MTDKRERLGQQYGPGDKFGIKKKKKKGNDTVLQLAQS